MIANNLTISIQNVGCDKNCPYCVSKMTGYVDNNKALMLKNVNKVLTIARSAQISAVLLTGKGEPCLNMYEVLTFTQLFSEFPLELQTNGIFLSQNLEVIKTLASQGMNVVAVSMDDDSSQIVKKISDTVHKSGMILRVTFNVTNNSRITNFNDLLYRCKSWGVDQLTLRKVVAPNFSEETQQTKWIKDNVDILLYSKLIDEMRRMCESGHHLRTLLYGTEVYDLQGIAVSYSDYCVQDDNNTNDIRSLIFQEDGHLYTSWNSKASVLF